MLYGLVNLNGNFKAFIVLQNAKLWSTRHISRGQFLVFVLLVMLTALICPNRALRICTTTWQWGIVPANQGCSITQVCLEHTSGVEGLKEARLEQGRALHGFLPGFSTGLY